MSDILTELIEDEIFILRKKLNTVNCEIEEKERDFEVKYPNSCVIIDFRLFDLYKKRKRLEKELSELKESLLCGRGILF
jgi:hypothetical protein